MAISQRGIKKEIIAMLGKETLHLVLARLADYPPEKLLNPLFAALCSASEKTRWTAISAFGATVARLADQEMEAARIVMRRLMWSLNDESGGIGWGSPEAMAESLARHQGLAEEYSKILVAFMRQDGFYLELPALQYGLLWGIARLAAVRPEALRRWQAPHYLLPYLNSEEPAVRGLAARALGLLGAAEYRQLIQPLINDSAPFSLYTGERLVPVTVGKLADEALIALKMG